jgi:predicted metalloprotease
MHVHRIVARLAAGLLVVLMAAVPVSAAPIEGVAGGDFDAAISYNRGELFSYWDTYLSDPPLAAPGVSWINEAGGTATGCGNFEADRGIAEGAFYCSIDKVVYVDISYLRYNNERWGASAVAATMAHEYGHHIQRLLGTLYDPDLTSRMIELQADCMAGAFMHWYQSGDEGLVDLPLLQGRYETMGSPKGTDPLAKRSHGTGAERSAAFTTGWSVWDNPTWCATDYRP